MLRQPTGQTEQRQHATKKILIAPILFLYYEESLVSSNLNSKQLRFHCAQPNLDTIFKTLNVAQNKKAWSIIASVIHEFVDVYKFE